MSGRARYGAAAALSVVAAAVVVAAVVGSGHGSSKWTDASRSGNGHVENGHYCDGCAPPLVFNGGPVADTSGSRGLTIIPIYWQPAGGGYAFPPGYVSTVSRYIADVAAASGGGQNVYSLVDEYYGKIAASRQSLRYRITAGRPIVDTEPFPAGRCRPAGSEYGICLTDAQLGRRARDQGEQPSDRARGPLPRLLPRRCGDDGLRRRNLGR